MRERDPRAARARREMPLPKDDAATCVPVAMTREDPAVDVDGDDRRGARHGTRRDRHDVMRISESRDKPLEGYIVEATAAVMVVP